MYDKATVEFDGDSRGRASGILLGRFVYWLLRENWEKPNEFLQAIVEQEFPNRRTTQKISAYRSYCRHDPDRMGKGLPPINGKLNASQRLEFADVQESMNSIRSSKSEVVETVRVGELFQAVKTRVGQLEFSVIVRENYAHRCCFPGCDVDDDLLLVGAHIERWADAPTVRGNIANSLCFCALHDRAFEVGLFVLTDTYESASTQKQVHQTGLQVI